MNRQKIIKKVSFSPFSDITARIRANMVDVLQASNASIAMVFYVICLRIDTNGARTFL